MSELIRDAEGRILVPLDNYVGCVPDNCVWMTPNEYKQHLVHKAVKAGSEFRYPPPARTHDGPQGCTISLLVALAITALCIAIFA